MTDLSQTRDKVYELLQEVSRNPQPNVLNILRTLVEEMHKLAGESNRAFKALENNLTVLDHRLATLEVTVGTEGNDVPPTHSTMPSISDFQQARKKK